jgi:hypothetical protein
MLWSCGKVNDEPPFTRRVFLGDHLKLASVDAEVYEVSREEWA